MNLDEAKTQLQNSQQNIDFIREIKTEAIQNEQLWVNTLDSLLGKLKERDFLILNLNSEIKSLKAKITQQEAEIKRLTSKDSLDKVMQEWEAEEHDG